MAGRAAGIPVVACAWCCIDALVRTVLRSSCFYWLQGLTYAYPAPSSCRRHPLPCHRRRHRHPHRYHRRQPRSPSPPRTLFCLGRPPSVIASP